MDGQVVFVTINKIETNIEEVINIKTNSVITVKYGGTNVYNKLIQPVFMRCRADLNWSEFVQIHSIIK